MLQYLLEPFDKVITIIFEIVNYDYWLFVIDKPKVDFEKFIILILIIEIISYNLF